jgi:hypothetical protein
MNVNPTSTQDLVAYIMVRSVSMFVGYNMLQYYGYYGFLVAPPYVVSICDL